MTTPQDPDRGPQQPHIPAPPPLSESELHGTPSAAGPALPVPKEVQISFWIWIAGAVLSVIGGLLAFAQRDAVADALRRAPQTADLSAEEFDALVSANIMITAVVGVVMAGLYVLFAFKARAGRNWARVVLAALTVLGLLSTLLVGAGVSGLLTSLISVVAVVLLYLPNSKAYFDSVKRAR
ncbi:hypothetical protein ABZ816_11880 [Actinosynnema sp. NPDC047251]|uniref:hypothetical protein n=1 Tax=Saccharothrix espanaensis TaxID=103731 RepID=UPI00031F34D0|nr:hypothetical protein [Saccharothrix espanaensis]